MSVQTNENGQLASPYVDSQECDLPETTVMFGGEMMEDLQPLADQGRLTITFNGYTYRPPYIYVDEKTGTHTQHVDITELDDFQGRGTVDVNNQVSYGFEITVRFRDFLSPSALADNGMGPTVLGLNFNGIHRNWVSQNCSIVDYDFGRNEDGHYELTFQTTEFRGELQSEDAE